MTQRLVVYTAVMGQYESLVEQPQAASSAVDFICLTDDPRLMSETWDVRLVPPAFPNDHVRSARRLKILGSDHVNGYDASVWIDNRVHLKVPPEAIVERWLGQDDVALPAHSFRLDVLDEFRAVVDAGYDEPDRAYEQLWHYSREHPWVLDQKPLWTAIMVRRHTAAVASCMQRWFEHVLRYSRRDQLSVNAVLGDGCLSVGLHEIDNHESDLHRWLPPDQVGRNPATNDLAWRDAAATPMLRLRRLDAELRSLAEERNALQERVGALTTRIQHLESDVVAEQSRNHDLLMEIEAYQASTSWRVTAPLRTVSGLRASRRLSGPGSDPNQATG